MMNRSVRDIRYDEWFILGQIARNGGWPERVFARAFGKYERKSFASQYLHHQGGRKILNKFKQI